MKPMRFAAEIIEWRGPAPFMFVRLPDNVAAGVARVKRVASYGWGAIPVEAEIGGVSFTTSLFPKDGTYLLPLKVAVRKRVAMSVGDVVRVTMQIGGTIREPR